MTLALWGLLTDFVTCYYQALAISYRFPLPMDTEATTTLNSKWHWEFLDARFGKCRAVHSSLASIDYLQSLLQYLALLLALSSTRSGVFKRVTYLSVCNRMPVVMS